jgi:hypothetical protein
MLYKRRRFMSNQNYNLPSLTKKQVALKQIYDPVPNVRQYRRQLIDAHNKYMSHKNGRSNSSNQEDSSQE